MPRPAPGAPPPLRWPQVVDAPAVPPRHESSLRLVSARSLYDAGVTMGACPGLAGLAPGPVLAANPHDLDVLGVASGEAVRVRSARGALVLEVVADAAVVAGTGAIGFNLGPRAGDGAQETGGAGSLIDAGQTVVDVRLETL